MWHKPCRTFHPWCPCIKTRCLLNLALTTRECFINVDRILSFPNILTLYQNCIFPRIGKISCGIKKPPLEIPLKISYPHKCVYFILSLNLKIFYISQGPRKLFETRSRPDLSQTSKSCIMELNRTSTTSRVQYVHKSLSKALHGLKITSWLSITSHGHIQPRKTHCLITVQNCTGGIISRPVTNVVGSTVFKIIPWWRHQMGTFSALLALCEGNPPVTAGFPSQRPVTRKFYVFFHLCLNKRLSKQSRRRWFETPSHALWRRCNATEI